VTKTRASTQSALTHGESPTTTPGAPVSDTSVRGTGLRVGGDVERALESVGVPSYVLDETGVVAPEETRRARELFSRKVLGTSPATEATGSLVSTAGTRVLVELSSVPLMSGERVVGVFGLIEARPTNSPTVPPPARSRCFVFWSRATRRSRSQPSST
jgi:hypothetical protein